jgi:O-antigen ligase
MESIESVLHQATWILTGLAVACVLIGIAPAEILLALALLCFLVQRSLFRAGHGNAQSLGPVDPRQQEFRAEFGWWKLPQEFLSRFLRWTAAAKIDFPPIMAPLIIFVGLTFLSYLFSPERALGRAPLNKFWLFSIPILVVNEFTRTRIFRTWHAIFALGTLAAVLSIIQYFFLARNTIRYRVTGFMGHWMTLSGELMLVLICLAGYLVFASERRRLLWSPLLCLLSFSLALTMTRSVWIATVVGLFLLLLMRYFHWKTLLTAAVSFSLITVMAPEAVQKRIRSVVDPQDPSNYARSAIWRAGLLMIEDHPWLGVGPQRVYRVFYNYHPHPEDRFRDGFFPVHLHNNLLQLAAERGIPCALAWLWLMFKLALDHWKGFRKSALLSEDRSIYVIGFVSVVVLCIAGVFEFNFGDSEVLMLFLFLVSAPYALTRRLSPSP